MTTDGDEQAEARAADVERWDRLRKLQRARRALDDDTRGRQSLESLRLGALLRQLEALQAIQGLQELRPSPPGSPQRYTIPEDPEERARLRQWLRFKIDWLEALLESSLQQLEALTVYEADRGGAGGDSSTPHAEQA